MPAHRKVPEDRQDNSPGRQLATVSQITGGKPAAKRRARSGWLQETRDAWAAYWESPAARVLAEHHVPTVYRLFSLRDAQQRALRIFNKAPMVQGSMKQPVMNPAMQTVRALERDIRALEDRLGMTPKAQANLGIKVGGPTGPTAADLNRMAGEEEDEELDGDDVGEDAGGALGAGAGMLPYDLSAFGDAP